MRDPEEEILTQEERELWQQALVEAERRTMNESEAINRAYRFLMQRKAALQ